MSEDSSGTVEAARKAAFDAFSVARANAINAYASLEHSVAMLFKAAMGGDIGSRKAFAAFAGMSFMRSRFVAIGKILHDECGDRYDTFYASLSQKVLNLEGTRNKIVHWIQTGPFEDRDVFLVEHPDPFADGFLRKADIELFTAKAEFYRLLTMYFATDVEHYDLISTTPGAKPWREIYREPVVYPPPTNHPLHPSHRKP